MASKTKRKNTNKKKNTRRKAVHSKTENSNAIRDDIILMITLLVSLLLLLSFFNLSGPVGRFVSSFLFGLIGLQAYILPFMIFFGVAFAISNSGNKAAKRKIISAIVFHFALAALIQLITKPYIKASIGLLEYFKESSQARNGGGIIGGIQVTFLCGLFDVPATYVIIITIMIISIIIISGKALLTFLAEKSKSSLEERIENQKIRREQVEVEQRRPPKTFIIENTMGDSEVVDEEEVEDKKWEPSFMDKLKGKKKKIEKEDDPFENLPKLDYDQAFDDTIGEVESVPNYEDELRKKFGNGNDSYDSKVEKTEVNIDDTDIEKLDLNSTVEEEKYVFPPISKLKLVRSKARGRVTDKSLKSTAKKLQDTLASFGVNVTIANVSCGPTVTRYELQPEQGVKVSKITSLSDDIKLNLAASDIRIEAPIPGKAAVGIEVPNDENSIVSLREMIESNEFKNHTSDIAFAVGKDIGGRVVIADIAKMPHLLIAGATGSGKSVCINTLIMSILYKSKPSDVRLILIDPKVVELNVYNGIPHLLIPVVTDPKKASSALNWAVNQMTERYKKFADTGARDIKSYNEKIEQAKGANGKNEEEGEVAEKLPQIVIIIDELADLMMVASNEVEDAIIRLAQLARAAGIHLIIATQRPSVNVITGLIKANIPSRIAFEVSSAIDSRTIIDGSGAEKLLGKGDMLFYPSGYPKPIRVQGAFVSEEEVHSVVKFLKENSETQYSEEVKQEIDNSKGNAILAQQQERDEYFFEAGRFIIEKDKASIGMLQRVYRIGFNRAARMMDQLAEAGVVGPEQGTKPREILMTLEEYEEFVKEGEG